MNLFREEPTHELSSYRTVKMRFGGDPVKQTLSLNIQVPWPQNHTHACTDARALRNACASTFPQRTRRANH
ncbi:hypothetical protein HPB47_022950 [Ixodes persulcatus]|uniref:Uncharacterized protein n=1 Tax=Ixodes persulcatus TaxID=34615 RepID=A0AC60Q871_IXOPE|nr:hypothetical protein HPB47_022950 [Ixodes persulcatus]